MSSATGTEWAPRHQNKVISARSPLKCESAEDCSYNGQCEKGQCVCEPQWQGSACGRSLSQPTIYIQWVFAPIHHIHTHLSVGVAAYPPYTYTYTRIHASDHHHTHTLMTYNIYTYILYIVKSKIIIIIVIRKQTKEDKNDNNNKHTKQKWLSGFLFGHSHLRGTGPLGSKPSLTAHR